jgi:hypothetical protein
MNPQIEELATLYVLDRLEPRERCAFEARLVCGPELAALVRELEAAVAQRIRALPQHEVPADLLARIESRLGALDAAESSPRGARAQPFPWIAFLRWGAAAVITASLAILAVQSLRRPSAVPIVMLAALDSQRSTLTELPLSGTNRDPDARFIQLASLAEKFWENSAQRPAAGQENRGYALFDSVSRQGFIAIEQLPAIAPGQRYHLWIADISSGAIRDAGILPLSDAPRGLYSFSIAASDGPTKPGRKNFFITVEDSSAPPVATPRGKVVLGDNGI